ncbi:hypothetical protein M422DRAFT_244617 [Sphaerobolus stellatus SS14]|nr:hypothetical protein M422DRAFT_244617 [Sphaerobolus stellatus SS14]
MAFATSLSAFGIKPSSSGTNAFGQPQNQPQVGTGIFGQPTQQQPTSAFGTAATQPTSVFGTGGSIFGNNANQNQPATGTSIFGSANAQQTQPGSTSIFGAAGGQQQQQQNQNTSSIFGNPSGQQNQGNTGGGLFGNNAGQTGASNIFGNTGGQQQNQTTGSSIFGNAGQQAQSQAGSNIFGNTAGQQQQPQAGSIFGNTAGQQQNQPQAGSNIFGSTQNQAGTGPSIFGNNQNQPAQGSSIFGSTQNKGPGSFGTGGGIFGGGNQQQPQQSQGGGLFGNTTTGTTGGSLFGQTSGLTSTQAHQQNVPFTKTTKFNDLPEQTQKIFEQIDAHIQGRIQISKDLKGKSLDEEPRKAVETIRKVHNDLASVLSTLQSDKAVVDEIRAKSDQSVQDAIIATRIMDGFKNPQQNGAYLKNHAGFSLEFFNRASEEIREKLQWYKTTIEQIERRLVSAQTQAQYNPQAIVATLQAQNTTFIALAGKTAELDVQLQKIKAQYRELWRAYTGSARDPFNELDRRPGDGGGLLNGLGSLHLSR